MEGIAGLRLCSLFGKTAGKQKKKEGVVEETGESCGWEEGRKPERGQVEEAFGKAWSRAGRFEQILFELEVDHEHQSWTKS